MKFLFLVVSIMSACTLVFSEETVSNDSYNGLPITEIKIRTKRIRENIVRNAIAVKEGDIFNSNDVEKIRRKLNGMRFFKKIDIATEKDETKNGVRILLNLEDGWFIFPLPFLSGGGGGTNGSLMLIERNIFKAAESIFIFGGGNQDGGYGMAGLTLDKFSFSGNYGKRSFTEWNYSDRGFNTAGQFRSSRSENNPEKYGSIENQYDKKIEGGGFRLRFPLVEDNVSGNVGFSSQKISYSNLVSGNFPNDQGKTNILTTGLNLLLRRPNSAGVPSDFSFSFQDFGAVFGFGMADLSSRIKPLDSIHKQLSTEFSASLADRSFGSDFNFLLASLALNPSITFRHRQRVSLRFKGATSLPENIPLSYKIATNRDLGLRGNYAREQRGDRGAGSSLNFSYPFRRTQRGVWTGELFADAAGVWNSGKSSYKEGLGFGFGYQFWRFPLPLGFTYSYSLDDRDSQVNFAFGGRF